MTQNEVANDVGNEVATGVVGIGLARADGSSLWDQDFGETAMRKTIAESLASQD